jgi:excisionase family DNA binding protein
MLTVPEAARRSGRNPETVRRWIRDGRLRARRVGTQHVIEEEDLEALLADAGETVPLPADWKETFWGGPVPNWVAMIRRSRSEH